MQLANYEAIFPMFWEHPAVKGVTHLGLRAEQPLAQCAGRLAGLVQAGSEGAQRPACEWLIKYVQNTKPEVSNNQAFWVSESAAAGTVVGTVLGTDTDAGSALSEWQIYTGVDQGAATLFSIDAGGVLRVADGAAIAADTATRYTIHVSVFDGYIRSDVRRVTINVSR